MYRSLSQFLLVTLILSTLSAHAEPFVTSHDRQFWIGEESFRFIGVNARGITHYGYGDALPFTSHNDRTWSLDQARWIGTRVIRTFVSNRYIDTQETGDRLQVLLDQCRARNIRVIVTLTDFYRTPFFPQGDYDYYVNAGTYRILGNAFFTGGFRENYLPQAVALAHRFRDDPAVFSWQVGNELRNDPNKQAFINFCLEVHGAIRAVAPNQMISIGVQGMGIVGLSHQDRVRLQTPFDFVTNHTYNGSDVENDIGLADLLGQPLMVGEAGMSGNDRPNRTNADIQKWINRGARGYLQWGFMATNHDNGDGDREYGVDRVFQTDWIEYAMMFQGWANILSPEPTPTPTATPSPTPVLHPAVLSVW